MQYSLKVSDLTKVYPAFTLDHVGFSLPQGSVMGLIGENGAGKTTTLKAILGLLLPHGGEVEILGAKGAKIPREEIGVVLDECHFPASLRPKEVSLILRHVYPNWDEGLFAGLLKKFGLTAEKKVKELSRGMKTKLSIAAALAHRPRLLILDEPAAGLDPIARNELLDIFWDFMQAEEASILISSHITSDLEKIADAITFLHEGKLLLCESKEALLEDYGILRCPKEGLPSLAPSDVLGLRKGELGCDVLIKDRRGAREKYPGWVVDRPTLEEIMLLLVKGERLS